MIKVFTKWGIPECIKFDNGAPFADPFKQFIPFLALWLIGLGIKVIFNRPGKPTDNAKVERMQAVTKNWSLAQKWDTPQKVQQALDQIADIQRNRYPLKRHGYKTRKELYPQLTQLSNVYNSTRFDIQKVYDFLSKGYWERLVSKTGQFDFYNQRFSIGRTYAQQYVIIKMNAQAKNWEVHNIKDDKVEQINVDTICKTKLCNL